MGRSSSDNSYRKHKTTRGLLTQSQSQDQILGSRETKDFEHATEIDSSHDSRGEVDALTGSEALSVNRRGVLRGVKLETNCEDPALNPK
jgi:hypothetical protein